MDSLSEQLERVEKTIEDVEQKIRDVEGQIEKSSDVEQTRYLRTKEDRLRGEKEQLRREKELLLQSRLNDVKPTQSKRRFTQNAVSTIGGYRFDSLRPLKRQKAEEVKEVQSFLEVPLEFVEVLKHTRTNCLHGMFFKSDRYTYMETELRSLLYESNFDRPFLIGGAPGSGKSLALHLLIHDAIIRTGKTVFWFACDQRANYKLFKFSKDPQHNKLLVVQLFHPNSPIMSVREFASALKTDTYLDKIDNEFHFVVSSTKRPVSTISNPFGNDVICVFDGVCGVKNGRSEADELLTAFGDGYPLIMTASLQTRLGSKAREGFQRVLVPSWTKEEFQSLLTSPMASVLKLYWSALRFYETIEHFSKALATQNLTTADHKEAMEYLKQQVSDPSSSLIDFGFPHFVNAPSLVPRLAPGTGQLIETDEELREELEKRYYYAGRNARFMVEKSIWNVANNIREQLATAINKPALLDDTQGIASTYDVSTIRCIDYRVNESGEVSERPALVSRYVFQIVLGCIRASDVVRARGLMENPCYQGWLDEFEFIQFVKSSSSIQLQNHRFVNDKVCCLDSAVAEFPRFSTLNPGTWLIPAKYNHKLYDIVYVQGTEDNRLCLWFIQIGRPKVHAFKLDTFQYDLQSIETQHRENSSQSSGRNGADRPLLSFEYRFMYVFTGKLEPEQTLDDHVKPHWVGSVPSPYRDFWKPMPQTITKVAWTRPAHPTFE